MSADHSHDGDFYLLLAFIVIISITLTIVILSFDNRFDVLEALHTPTPVATEEVPTA